MTVRIIDDNRRRARGRAHLQDDAGGHEHLLRGQVTAGVGPVCTRRLHDTADPIEDYLAALRLLEGLVGDVDVLVRGHGSVGGADQVHARIYQDRAYVHALRGAHVPGDHRVGPSATYGNIGCLACTNGHSSASPEEASAIVPGSSSTASAGAPTWNWPWPQVIPQFPKC